MKKLNRYLLILGLILAANIANAAVTLLSGNREGDTDGYNDYTPLRMNAPALRNTGLCSGSGKMICSSNNIKDSLDECQDGNMNFGLECCDATDGTTKFDCLPPCDAYQTAFPSTTLYLTRCSSEELNAESTGVVCLVDANTFKYVCKCGDEYTEDNPPNCEDSGLVTVNDRYECKAGENGSSKYLPVSEACANPICEANQGTSLDFDAYVNELHVENAQVSSIKITKNGCENRFYQGHPYDSTNTSQCRKKVTVETSSCLQNTVPLHGHFDANICTCPDDYKSIDDWKATNGNDDKEVPLVTIDKTSATPQITDGICFWNALKTDSYQKKTYDQVSTDDRSCTDNLSVSWDAHANDYSSIASEDGFFYNGTAGTLCKDWEINLIKTQYDENGYNFTHTDGCPDGTEERTCAYAFEGLAGTIGLPEGYKLYENVKFCACPRDNYGRHKYSDCLTYQVAGGKSCSLEEGKVRYEFCLNTCGDTPVAELDNIQTGCIDEIGSEVVTQTPTGTYPGYDHSDFKYWYDNNNSNLCLDETETTIANRFPKWECSCPSGYTDCPTEADQGGDHCKLGDDDVWEICNIKCDNDAYTIVNRTSDCSNGVTTKCYDDDAGSYKYMCECQSGYQTLVQYCKEQTGVYDQCVGDCSLCTQNNVGIPPECTYDYTNTDTGLTTVPKYEYFCTKCSALGGNNNNIVDNPDSCKFEDEVESIECCDDEANPQYICKCPNGWKTVSEYCNYDPNCMAEAQGIGVPCIYEDVNNPKYENYDIQCGPDDYIVDNKEDCGGDDFYRGVCVNTGGELKHVCKCPNSWYDENNCSGTKETAGETCTFIKNKTYYEKCLPKCDSLTTNGAGIEYLDEAEPSETSCRNKLGDGATYGASPTEPRCSKDHEIKYPCYCGADYSETCELSQNQLPPDNNPTTCTINGTVYYNQCKANNCKPESSTTAIINDNGSDPNLQCANAGYGTGATGRRCGFSKIECTCNTSTYNDLCKYPLSVPDNTNTPWCKYGDGSALMENGTPHYKNSDCSRKQILGKCGEYILNSDGSHNYSVTIHVTASDTICTSQYGTGATPVLCEYSDNPNRRAYNCWYDEREFIWTENNCPIRHVFGKRFIYRNKLKHYDTCDCHPNYKYHKFNCSKKLSGAACVQKLTTKQLSSDNTLQSAVDQRKINVGQNIQLYGYCK